MSDEAPMECPSPEGWGERSKVSDETPMECPSPEGWGERSKVPDETPMECPPPEGWEEWSKVSDEAIPHQSERATVRTEHFVHDKESKYLTI
ncbi:hypothetical protein M3650_08115 [Paenibacillus sp. MER TA 81-3]|nr:hypothetical protein [Paenibacillus sp. MER TA 81-3]